MRKLALVALTMLIGTPVVPAVAGECDKVRSSYTRAVCNTPELTQLNQRMELTLDALAQKLSPENQLELAAGHRQWRHYARLACTENGVITPEPYSQSELECLAGLLGDREAFLSRDWSFEGVQTFPREAYSALPDPEGFMGPMVGSFRFYATLIDGDDENTEAFNAYALGGYGDGSLRPETGLAEFDGGAEVDVNTDIVEITSRRISSEVNYYAYYHGAAHGSSSITYEHFLIGEKRPLQAGDIFVGLDWRQRLIAITKAQIIADPDLSEAVWEDLETVEIVAADPTRWRFTQRGIEIQFQPYEITPYVVGLPSIEIPWADLEGMLAPGALAIAGAE